MGTVLITGASRGLGREAVRHIVSVGGKDIVLAMRSPDEAKAVAAELRDRYGANVRTIALDVSSLRSVREGADAFRQSVERGEVRPLSTLILNAGTQSAAAVEYTADGYERVFATNCLGHFLLMNLLLDDIQSDGRVVWTASGTHDPDTMDGRLVGRAVAPEAEALANTGKDGKPLSAGVRYTTSKLCVMLYSYELDRRLRRAGRAVASIAYDPGYVPETGLMRTSPAPARWFARTGLFKWLFGLFGGTIGDLASSGIGLGRVAVDPEYAAATGRYIQASGGVLREARSSAASYDAGSAERLWRDSARLVGLAADDGHSRPR